MVLFSWGGGTSHLKERYVEDKGDTYSLEGGTRQPEGGTYNLMGGISMIRVVPFGWMAVPVRLGAAPII